MTIEVVWAVGCLAIGTAIAAVAIQPLLFCCRCQACRSRRERMKGTK